MAILIVEHNGTLEGASLSGRILIGRRASNHVVIDDPAVSRIHAWIDTADRQFCVTDAGSRTGTFVNGQRVAGGKVALRHGDRITVGPASLIFRADATLPAGVSQLNFSDRTAPPEAAARDAGLSTRPHAEADGGILFDCPSCHSPLWIAAEFAGRMGKCRFCGTVLRVPERAGVPARPAPAPSTAVTGSPAGPSASPMRAAVAAPAEACGACQSPVEAGEASTTCPDCGLTFHADCWAENYGCSAYGCSQVNVLLPKADPGRHAEPGQPAAPAGGQPPAGLGGVGDDTAEPADVVNAPKVTAEYALLAGSVVGVVLGALTFGVPALLACAAAILYITKLRRTGRRGTPRVVLAAAVLAGLGAAAGAAVSYVWWLGDAGHAGTELPLISPVPHEPAAANSEP